MPMRKLTSAALALAAALSGTGAAADDMHLTERQTPKPVLAAAHRLQACAAATPVHPGDDQPFAYCGIRIDWDPKRANEARRCLAKGVFAIASKHPSEHTRHAVTYAVSIGCQGLVVVEVDYAKGVARVVQAEEALP